MGPYFVFNVRKSDGGWELLGTANKPYVADVTIDGEVPVKGMESEVKLPRTLLFGKNVKATVFQSEHSNILFVHSDEIGVRKDS